MDVRGAGAHPLIRVETTIGSTTLVIYYVYLSAPGGNAEAKQRNDVLTILAARVAADTIPRAVIVGLGAAPWSHAFRILTDESDLIDSSPGNG